MKILTQVKMRFVVLKIFEEFEIIHNLDIKGQIVIWVVNHTIINRAVNDLLNINKHFPFLPKDVIF